MTARIAVLIGLLAGLFVLTPPALAQSPDVWVYASVTADPSLVFGYAEADLWYPASQCTGSDLQSCWVDYDIDIDIELRLNGSYVYSYWWYQYCGGAYVWVSQSNPNPGAWDIDVTCSSLVNWHWHTYSYAYNERTDYLWGWGGAGTYLEGSAAPPLIGSIVPSGALRGESGQLTITGEHFGDSPYVQVGGEGVTITVTSISGGYIYVDYSIETDAPSGDHPVTVSTPYGESDPVSFMVQDPNPTITSISPDEWEAGTTFSVTITGTGFGNNPTVDAGSYASVQVNSSNGTVIDATVTVSSNAPDAEQEVLVTSNGWGGMGFLSSGGQQTPASGTVDIFGPVPICGDQLKDWLIEEYYTYNVTWKPSCSDVTSPRGSTNFSASEMNKSNDYGPWTITKWDLLTGLENIRAAAGDLPMPVYSGYRNPKHNHDMTPPGAQNSRHMYGDAADITETNTARRISFHDTLGHQYGACVEPLGATPTWVHFDWRPARPCPAGW